MISISVLLKIVWIHFIADFLLQSTWMGINKSKDNKVLCLHALFYMFPFLCFGPKFAVLSGTLHIVIDYFTSRITSKLWEKKKVHWFFVVIGMDQAIHMSLLFLTYKWLFL